MTEKASRTVAPELAALIPHLTDGVVVLDAAGLVLAVNPSASRLLGRPAATLTGRPLATCLAAEDSEVVSPRTLSDAAAGVVDASLEVRVVLPDGGLVPMELCVSAAGEHWIGVLRELPGQSVGPARASSSLDLQRLLNRLLRLSLRPGDLDQLLDAALDTILATPWLPTIPKGGIFLLDEASGELVLRVERRLGLALRQLCGRVALGHCLCGRVAQSRELLAVSGVDHRHDIHYAGMQPHGHYVVPIATSDRLYGVLVLYLADGHACADGEALFLHAVGRTLAGLVARRAAEDQAGRMTRELQERNADLETFALETSHDLKAPLLKVRRFGQHLRDRLGDRLDPDLSRSLERVERTTERMQQLIDGVLAYGVLRDVAREGVDLDRVLDEVLEDLMVCLDEVGGSLVSDPLPVVRGSVSQLRQLFANLLGNAIRYRRADVPLCIEVRRRVSTDEQGRPELCIEISDNGRGFGAEHEEQIFEPFQRLEPLAAAGSGVGLATCRRIVSRHGGSLVARGQPGQGATFVIRLPWEPALVSGPPASEAPLTVDIGLSILIVDDDDDDAFFTERAVLGCAAQADVKRVSNGQELLRRLQAGARFDAVLLDIHMPVMGAAELLDALAERPELDAPPLILMSDPSVARALLGDRVGPVFGYVAKPPDSRALARLFAALPTLAT